MEPWPVNCSCSLMTTELANAEITPADVPRRRALDSNRTIRPDIRRLPLLGQSKVARSRPRPWNLTTCEPACFSGKARKNLGREPDAASMKRIRA